MLATSPRNDTTVALPTISADELASLVQQMIAGEPTAAARIQRGAGVLLAGALADTDTLGVYRVLGCDGRIYRTSSGSCSCPDSVNRGVTCKHSWAARLLSAASAVASWARRAAGEPNPPPPPAPATAVCRSCGRDADVDRHGWCDLCAWDDAITVFELTPAGMTYLDRQAARTDRRVAVGA